VSQRFFLLLIATLFVLFFLNILVPIYCKTILRKAFLAKIKKSGSICLTFDDGPNPQSTPAILNILEEARIRATFFVTGENARKYPEIIKSILSRGHEIGEHGLRHIHPWTSFPLHSFIDLLRGSAVLKKLTGKRAALLRPPYGKLDLMSLLYIWCSDKQLVFWDIDPRDYENHAAEEIADSIMQGLASGSVILLHDGRADTAGGASATVAALKLVLSRSAAKNYSFATISKALHSTAADR